MTPELTASSAESAAAPTPAAAQAPGLPSAAPPAAPGQTAEGVGLTDGSAPPAREDKPSADRPVAPQTVDAASQTAPGETPASTVAAVSAEAGGQTSSGEGPPGAPARAPVTTGGCAPTTAPAPARAARDAAPVLVKLIEARLWRPGAVPPAPPEVGPITLSVRQGQWLGIVGASGSGKSAIARLLAGLVVPDAGSWATALPARIRRRAIRYLPQYHPLGSAERTGRALSQLASIRGFAGPRRRQVVDEVIDLLWLEPILQRRQATLSWPVQRRVAFASVLLGRPRLLVLDNPFAASDELAAKMLRELFAALREREALAVVMLSRNAREIAPLVDEMVELTSAGEIRYHGPAARWKAERGGTGVFRVTVKGPGGEIQKLLATTEGVSRVLWEAGGAYNTFTLLARREPIVRERLFRILAERRHPLVELSALPDDVAFDVVADAPPPAATQASRAAAFELAARPAPAGTQSLGSATAAAAVSEASESASPPSVCATPAIEAASLAASLEPPPLTEADGVTPAPSAECVATPAVAKAPAAPVAPPEGEQVRVAPVAQAAAALDSAEPTATTPPVESPLATGPKDTGIADAGDDIEEPEVLDFELPSTD